MAESQRSRTIDTARLRYPFCPVTSRAAGAYTRSSALLRRQHRQASVRDHCRETMDAQTSASFRTRSIQVFSTRCSPPVDRLQSPTTNGPTAARNLPEARPTPARNSENTESCPSQPHTPETALAPAGSPDRCLLERYALNKYKTGDRICSRLPSESFDASLLRR